ncbi:MAG: zf-HC2 domain-containing protein [Rhodothermales bacterium]
MKPIDDLPADAWIDERLEAFLDDELPPEERAEMERALDARAMWSARLDLAERIKTTLHATDTPPAPPQLTRTILARTRRLWWRERLRHGLNLFVLPLRAAWQPALALASVAMLATFLYFADGLGLRPPSTVPEPSVEQALAEVKWTLGYISKTGKKTGESVQNAMGPMLRETPHE